MKHNMTAHILWMVGGFGALLLIDKLFRINIAFLFPLLCMGMMVWMMFAMNHNDHNDHK
jgi:hypothetical protein